jgi:hypothetical protein
MTDSEHTTAKLARALEAIPGVPAEMIERARTGFYHDFLSPLDFPEIQLVTDLRELADRPATPRNSRPLLRALAEAVKNGEYDASKAESDEWMRSPEGQEAMAALAGPAPRQAPRLVEHGPPPAAGDGDAVKACADLVGRTGARSFECGYVNEGVPVAESGWYATALYKGMRITEQDKASPAEACDALAARLLSGGQCQHCGKLVTLNPAGAVARDVTLADGRKWTAAEQAQAGLCHWTRAGARWERGCAS